MPTVYEGIGTWYYGKRRIHRLKGTCGFCKAVGELTSYDTTLYFVFFFVPLIPLARKRVLSQCPSCQKHQVLPLKKWEAAKAKDMAQLLERLVQNPDDRDTVISGLRMALAYQDEVFFNRLASSLTPGDLEDPAVQAQLGAGYSYFSRWEEAETSYRASLAAQDQPEVRQQLALVLLKRKRPAEAAPLLLPILDAKNKEQAGMIYLLVEAYQAEGMHAEALDLIDRRDAAFPELADLSEHKKQRKTSERYLNSGKKIPSAFLRESARAGYREGSWTAAIPRLIGPLLVLALVAWYLGAAIWIGQARRVYLANGAPRAYRIACNGRELTLPPGAALPVEVPEGEVAIEFRDAGLGLEPVRCRVETPFFSRPFRGRTFVINPDRLAFVVREHAEYAEFPRAAETPPELHLGEVLYAFQGIDYEFTPFPQSLKLKRGQTLHKTGLSVVPNLSSENRLAIISQKLDEPQRLEYAKRLLRFDPKDLVVLSWLLDQIEDREAIVFLQPGLAVRPVLVEWHRAYQDRMEKTRPDQGLRDTYRQLVAETNGDADARYLLARVLDPDEDLPLLRQAAEGERPSAYAQYSLGYQALAEGEFAEAVRWSERAVRRAPSNPLFQQTYRWALLAAGDSDRLVQDLQTAPKSAAWDFSGAVEKLRAYARKGDKGKARAVIEEAVQAVPAGGAEDLRRLIKTGLEMTLCCCEHDVAGYLKLAATMPSQPSFVTALLRGNLSEAAGAADARRPQEAAVQHGLLYLAALQAGDSKRAEEAWKHLLTALAEGNRHDRRLEAMLAGRQPLRPDRVRRLAVAPQEKRVLAAVAARRAPDHGKELTELARRLDFFGDVTSLCLWKVTDRPGP
jgi:tetratricopeptide (TPR) repeat protein